MRSVPLIPSRLFALWAASTLIAASALDPAAASGAAMRFVPRFVEAPYGEGAGRSGMQHADLNGDGLEELVFGDNGYGAPANEFWSVQYYDRRAQRYDLHWQSPFYPEYILNLAVLRFGDRAPHIYLSLGNGEIEVRPSGDLASFRRIKVGDDAVWQTASADADNDGSLDLVALTATATYLYDPSTLLLRRTIPVGGSAFGIADVDGSPGVEIAYDSGYVVSQDGAAFTLDWDYTQAFGAYFAVGDLDGNGRAEIVAAEQWHNLRAFDAKTRSVKWHRRTDLDISALSIHDMTGDGVGEVVWAEAQRTRIHILAGDDGRPLDTIEYEEPGVGDTVVYDADGDGRLEFVFSAGVNISSGKHIRVLDLATLALEYVTVQRDPGFFGLAVGDVDGDGRKEYVSASFLSESSYGTGIVSVYDAANYRFRWQTGPDSMPHMSTGLRDLVLADLNKDGAEEIIVSGDEGYAGAFFVIDGKKRKMTEWHSYDDGSSFNVIAVGDVDADGRLDLVAAGDKVHTGSPGTFVYVINPRSGNVRWTSHSLTESWEGAYDLKLANLDADPALEIIASLGHVFVFDGRTHEGWQTERNDFWAVAPMPVSGDPTRSQLVAGSNDGRLWLLNAATGSPSVLGKPCTSFVAGLAYLRASTLIFGCDRTLGTFNMRTHAVTWSSQVSAGLAAGGNNIPVWRTGGRWRFAASTFPSATVMMQAE
ncbi:MAG TPA: VCBS repeat-containing protein [Candidatus Limnocylindrales bacterium]|nr:VCBS repeat-containing protein [Candidatus Limnocylindrales bacterium]